MSFHSAKFRFRFTFTHVLHASIKLIIKNFQSPDFGLQHLIIQRIRGRFFDPKATLRAEDRRRNSGELKWMELTVKQKNKKYRGVQNTCAPLTVFKCHSYTTSNVTNILSSMSLIYSLLCQGYTHSCLRGILTSAYEVFSILCKGYPQRVCLALC